MMEESAHQNQGRGPTFSLGTFARNPNRAAGTALGGTASGCLCLDCSAFELVLLPTPTYKKNSSPISYCVSYYDDCMSIQQGKEEART